LRKRQPEWLRFGLAAQTPLARDNKSLVSLGP
jgi:hypothetical protein